MLRNVAQGLRRAMKITSKAVSGKPEGNHFGTTISYGKGDRY
jgi:hypothetical protein